MSNRPVVAALLVLGLVLPFADKPVHIDDTNFLALARGAALDLWRPHAVSINWQGTSEQAFDVLSNPPGIGWWLAPFWDASVQVQHLWMTPWLLLALWGCHRLGVELLGRGLPLMLVLGTSPLVVLAAQGLTPDLPLFACTVAGVGGFFGARRHGWVWALLAGCAALFRYSGLCLVPVLILAGGLRGGVRGALFGACSLLPFLALTAHDISAYGGSHFLAMTGFQGVANTSHEVFRKLVASLAMLGGAGLLPFLAFRRHGLPGAVVGAVLGAVAVSVSGLEGWSVPLTVLFTASGGAAYALIRLRSRDDIVIAAWALGGLFFLLSLRFAAGRYWLPFLPALAIAGLRLRPGRGAIAGLVATQALLSLLLAGDDRAFARAHQTAAAAVVARYPDGGQFSGHWGWQHALEKAGWQALEEDAAPVGRLAVAETPWPQQPDVRVCLEPGWAFEVPDVRAGPRVHTREGRANLHAYVVAGIEPVETYAPWGFSSEPYERVVVYERCDR